MTEGSFPKSDGDVLYASEVNTFQNPIKVVYVGTGFNSTKSGAAGNDEQDHELDSISSTDLNGTTYIKIKILGTAYVMNDQSGTANDKVELKIQTKDIGGSYSDSIAYKPVLQNSNYSSDAVRETTTYTFEWIHTLTTTEKSAGIQVKVFSKSTTSGTTAICTFTNVQTAVELG